MNEQGNTPGTGTPSVRRPEVVQGRVRRAVAGARTGTTRRRVVAVVSAAALGFAGAAAVDRFALAAPPLVPVADLGPAGDGLTRLLVTGDAGSVSDAELAALRSTSGVVGVQRVFDGSVLVATQDLAPADLAGVVPAAEVEVSPSGEFTAAPITDPFWSSYGYNLANTGANAFNQRAVAGADVDAPTGWRAGTGAGMVLAVTDSGMDTSHPDLQGALWTNPACGTDADGDGLVGDCNGWNFYVGNADVVNAGGNSHGTGVAGIAGARAGNGEGSAGVAPDVQIMPLVVGYGKNVDITAAAAAIVYAVDHGADVINASWGGNGMSPALVAALDHAAAEGVLVVAAAGNDSGNRDVTPTYPANSTSPAVLSVGSSTAADTISSFSGYGATTVDLFAPGSGIVSPAPGGGYTAMDGTSMAAPEVAAAVALYRARYPSIPMAQLRQQLLDDTQPVPAFAGRSVTGGRLSLTALGNTATAVQYSFTSMVADPGPVTPQVVATGSLPAGGYSVRLGLGQEHLGELYALSGQDLTLGGTTLATDDAGEAVFDLGARSGSSLVLSPSTELAAARYVLTVQLFRDGVPAGLRFAAPLLVGQPRSAPGAAAPTGGAAAPTSASSPSSSAPGGTSTPGSPTGSAPGVPTVGAPAAPTATVPGGTGSSPTGAPAASTTAASTSAATPTRASTPAAPTSSSAVAVPTGAAPSTSAGAPATTPAPGASVPPGSTAPTSAGTPPGSSAPSSPAAGGAPGPGGTKTYPANDPFGLTSITPTRVTVSGGTRVTITGSAIPAGAAVRIGASTAAVVSSVSTTQLVFTTPALLAGTYDVHVFDASRTVTSVLTGGLTYLPADGAAAPPSAGSTAPSSAPEAGTPTAAPAPPTAVTGPNGERLVRSASLRSLVPAIWKVNCASSCSGRAF